MSICADNACKYMWQAKPETMQKVCDIVKKQLALPSETQLTPESKFVDLGADSLDTVHRNEIFFLMFC